MIFFLSLARTLFVSIKPVVFFFINILRKATHARSSLATLSVARKNWEILLKNKSNNEQHTLCVKKANQSLISTERANYVVIGRLQVNELLSRIHHIQFSDKLRTLACLCAH